MDDAFMNPSAPVIIIAAVILVPIIYLIATANRFISLRNHIRESWSNIDVLLKRRYELIPNLVATVKGYAKHERELFESVTNARNTAVASTGRVEQQAADETKLVHAVNMLLARAEAYPELKASENFLALQQELVNTEDRIAAARRFYNANVREHNTLVDQFPSMLVARMMSRGPEDFFEIESLAIRTPPTLAL
jgi:LemA protein